MFAVVDADSGGVGAFEEEECEAGVGGLVEDLALICVSPLLGNARLEGRDENLDLHKYLLAHCILCKKSLFHFLVYI